MLRLFFCTRTHFSSQLVIKRSFSRSFSSSCHHVTSVPSSCHHVTSVPDPCAVTTSYLSSACGLSPPKAADVSRKLGRIRSLQRADAVLALLGSYNFSAAQVTRIIERRPSALCIKPETLKPKLDFLLSAGFSSSDVPKLFCSDSRLLHTSLSERMTPNIEKLKSVYGQGDRVVEAILSVPRLLIQNLDTCLLPNVEALRRHGVSDQIIWAFIKRKPRAVFMRAERFEELAVQLEQMGYDLSAGGLQIRALMVALGMVGKNWDKKLTLLKGLGWSQNDILGAFRRMPNFLEVSEEKLRIRVEFFTNQIKWTPSSLAERPIMLMLSVEKRLIPRLSVFNLLVQKGKICRQIYEIHLFTMSEKTFLKNYIHKFQSEVPEVIDAYEGRLQLTGFEMACNKTPNVKTLLQHGVPGVTIKKLIATQSEALLVSPLHLKAVFQGLTLMKYDVSGDTFCDALTVLATMSNLTSKEKFAFFQSLGWSDNDVFSALKKDPKYVTVPEDKVQRLMKFFMDEVGWNAPKVAANPSLLLLDLEGTILRRFSVYGVLASHKLVKKQRLTADFFLMDENAFLAKFVSKYQQKIPKLLQVYRDASTFTGN